MLWGMEYNVFVSKYLEHGYYSKLINYIVSLDINVFTDIIRK